MIPDVYKRQGRVPEKQSVWQKNTNSLKPEARRLYFCLLYTSVLEQLLAAAQDGERVVILTSDHGHVLEAGTKLQPSDPGQRFRHPNLPVKPGEFLISGSRVIGPGAGKMIVAWSEKLRYTKKQPGYHGGISPQECIVPVEVLIRGTRSLKGFEPSAVLFPDWW